MKNNNKVRTTFGRYLEFNNVIELRKFMFDYSEMFTAYSEETISYEKNADVASWMRLGIKMINDKMVIVNITKDNFDIIKGMFRKEVFGRNRSKYVFIKGIG